MKTRILSVIFITITFIIKAQSTQVPDNNFENYLETHNAEGTVVALGSPDSMGNGVANDDKVYTSRITNVTKLNVSGLVISNLEGIQDFSALIQLYVENNYLEDLNLNNNSNLQELFCNNNFIKSLNLSNNKKMNVVKAHFNQLTSLDVSSNPDINYLSCNKNKLTSLDVSSIKDLISLFCADNLLTRLNLANGENSLLETLSARWNPNLECIQVDDVNNIGEEWEKDLEASYSENCNTYIPDDNFEQALIYLGYDDVIDDYVTTSNINTLTSLNIANKSISDLKGIEDFIALEALYAGSNYDLETVDLTSNVNLKYINLEYCGNISSLDLSTNTLLETIYIANNKIATFDAQHMSNLKELHIYNNPISNLNIDSNINLEKLDVSNTDISTINLTNHTLLSYLGISSTGINNLNLTTNTLLKELNFQSTSITEIDLSNNSNIEELTFNGLVTNFDTTVFSNLKKIRSYENQTSLVTLDVSKSINLESIYIRSADALEKVNLKNGNNTNFIVGGSQFIIGGTNDLKCVQVDDKDYSEINWTDAHTGSLMFPFRGSVPYSETCFDEINIPDTNFEQALIDLGHDNVLDGKILRPNVSELTSLDVSEKNISDLTGIENFTSLTSLKCSRNNITELDISANVELTKIECQFNLISTLDFSKNTKLTYIDCYNNELTQLNVKNGNNANVINFRVSANSNLQCIQVDNAAFSTESFENESIWLRIPAGAMFSENCNATASVLDSEFNNSVILYPNPVNSLLQIEISNKQELESIQVYNLLGKKIVEENNNTINFASIKSGIYIVKIKSKEGKVAVKRVIKK